MHSINNIYNKYTSKALMFQKNQDILIAQNFLTSN